MKIEVRENKVIIDGYVNAVERFSKVLHDRDGNFIEKIMPKVFQRALEKNDEVKVLLNHNYDKELANTKDGSAELYEDNIGLRAKVEITDKEVIEDAKNNKLTGWSFGFICNKEEETKNKDGIRERVVQDIDLIEVSILNSIKSPAYIATSIEMRDGDIKEIEFRTEEFDSGSEQNLKPSLTSSQKRELLSTEFLKIFKNGYLEDFDDNYIYGNTGEYQEVYKIPYTLENSNITLDSTNKIKVIRGYQEVRSMKKRVDYSKYDKRIQNLKEVNK